MKVDIIPIGNSKGIRIPKSLLEQCHLNGTVDIAVENSRLVVSSLTKPRSGWEEAFKAMAANKDDTLLTTPATVFDKDEWQW